MSLLDQALAGAAGAAPPVARDSACPDSTAAPGRGSLRPRLLLAGGAGVLGSAVLEAVLGHGGFAQVQVLAHRDLGSAAVGLSWLPVLDGGLPPLAGPAPQVAVCVLDRPRHANGREAALWQPAAPELPRLAESLRGAGVECLLLVTPVDTARWPAALRQGLASLDEQAVASLGWRSFALVRPAAAAANGPTKGPARLAQALLASLRLMIPVADQPVRTPQLARLVAHLAHAMPASPGAARVLASDGVWQATQVADLAAWARAWLHGQPLPAPRARPGRL